MKLFIVGLCSVVLLGCSLPSSEKINEALPFDVSIDQTDDQSTLKNPMRSEVIEATIGQQVFNLEVSRTDADRQMGLMHRKNMKYNEGMLFVFDQPDMYRFWMKNTLIPLDILWLDENKTIVDFQTVQPCVADDCEIVTPQNQSLYVIELPAGSFIEKVGTVVDFEL